MRLAAAGDAAAVRAIYAPYVEGTAITFEETVPSVDEMRRRIEDTVAILPWLVCEEGDAILGYTYAVPFRPRPAYRFSVETTVYVSEEQRARGVGSALTLSLLAVLELQGYRLAVAGIALPNEASVRLHEKHGFRRVGVLGDVGFKLGRWHAVGWWVRDIRELDDDPQPPRPLAALPKPQALEDAIAAGPRAVGWKRETADERDR